jgi:hypothetical protein
MGFDAFILAAALAGAQPSGEAARPPVAALAAFDSALAAGEITDAARLHQAMLDARAIEDRPLRPDPLLASATGRLLLETGQVGAALEYLRTVDPAVLAPADRRTLLLARAKAEEAAGDRRAALATLRALPAESGGAGEEAALGIGRNLLPDDPAAALAQVRPVAASTDAARRLGAELIAAQAHGLLGDRASAAAAAARAWAGAADAPAAALAPMRTALVRAGLAAERGDRDAMLSMLGLAGAASLPVGRGIGASLPVCGEGGMRPDDRVTVGLYRSSVATEHVVPIAATRPAAAALMLDALAGRALIGADASVPAGTILTLRCQTVPSSNWSAPERAGDPWTRWFADRGFYFPVAQESSLETINRLSQRIDDAARRLGDEHPQLIPLRSALFGLLQMRAASDGDVEAWQIAGLEEKVTRAMRRLGGAEAVLPTEQMEADKKRVDAISDPAASRAAALEVLQSMMTQAPLDLAYAVFRDLPPGEALSTADRIRAASALARRFEALPAADPRRRAVHLRLAHLQRASGDPAAARAAVRAAGIAPGTCEAADVEPEAGAVLVSHFSDEDYPAEAQRFGLSGLSQFEFDVSAAGKASNLRMVVSAAPLLFDAIVAEKVRQVSLTPAKVAGKARACRAASQSVTWRMPQSGEDVGEGGMTGFRPPDPNAT